VGWLRRLKLRRQIVKQLRWQHHVLWRKQCSAEMQLLQIESRSKFGSKPYRIKYMELLDICEELGRLERDMKRFGLWFILTGKK
jgi:hypothetical protein